MSTLFGTIAGRVLAANGTPAAGAIVAIVGGTQPHRDIAIVAAADGRFQFGRLAVGRYRVQAHANGKRGAADIDVAEGAPAQVEIRLDA